MGVDYYNCAKCNDIFAYGGDYGHCGNCEEWLCGSCYDDMVRKNGYLSENHPNFGNFGEHAAKCCDLCTGEIIDQNEFFQFVIAKTGLTEEQLEEEYRNIKLTEMNKNGN